MHSSNWIIENPPKGNEWRVKISNLLSCHRFFDGIRKPRISETWKPARDGVFGGGWQDGGPKKKQLVTFPPRKKK